MNSYEFNELRNSMSSCLAKSAFVIGLTGGAELRSAAGESVTSITSITSVMSGTIEDRMELGKEVRFHETEGSSQNSVVSF